ncbi:hypothetical protein DBR43_09775 [Pedobacter sp. KBW06]|uniref:type IV toxin-antitoxin system AbiEi family antitoxin domain-containing protein n=1 Tax=Pedobacter sp. KBW06 TaxID=2153359 RepID=UPI000F59E8D0|nr:hypothetical protein [Pedobacter sp. KBW06]RQO75616.1 hypothetical protein DBR43_09775 [Pedobacter sp. KBW06]
MGAIEAIRSYATQPITHQLLLSLLPGYKRPNDKIHELLSSGVLIALKRGMYMIGPKLRTNLKPEPFLVANHLLGPSYISVDSALSYYGLIPERVFAYASMTTKAARSFKTPLGTFSYNRLPLPYYTFGVQRLELATDQFAMVASPEKALLDKIVTTTGLILRSVKAVENYLIGDLRMDEENLRNLNLSLMSLWGDEAPKKESILMVIKMIENL